MVELKTAQEYLERKTEILDKLSANTESQHRLLYKLHMKGLRRLLNEREVLLRELAKLQKHYAASEVLQAGLKLLAPQREAMMVKQQQVLERSLQAIQAAEIERNRIGAELSQSKRKRSLRKQYVNPYSVIIPGRRINRKG